MERTFSIILWRLREDSEQTAIEISPVALGNRARIASLCRPIAQPIKAKQDKMLILLCAASSFCKLLIGLLKVIPVIRRHTFIAFSQKKVISQFIVRGSCLTVQKRRSSGYVVCPQAK